MCWLLLWLLVYSRLLWLRIPTTGNGGYAMLKRILRRAKTIAQATGGINFVLLAITNFPTFDYPYFTEWLLLRVSAHNLRHAHIVNPKSAKYAGFSRLAREPN